MLRSAWILLLAAGSLLSQSTSSDKLAPLRFLVGDWVGEGEGQPGRAAGGFTFASDLEGNILTRRSRAAYPATKDRPAFVHADFTVVFSSPTGIRAQYFDNEGHVIPYSVDVATKNVITFLSDEAAGTPRFRLTYRKEEEQVRVTFEIAPPGQTFQTYTEGVVSRRSK